MSSHNPFSAFQIAVPKKYSEEIKKFCKQSETQAQGEYTPFDRQVDLWYFAFAYAVRNDLAPESISNHEMSNITYASILADYQSTHMQMVYLAEHLDIGKLDNSREIFNHISALANAGIPHVIQILKDIEEGKPLLNILDFIEDAT